MPVWLVPPTWLIVLDFLKLLADEILACRGARVIRIFCRSMRTLSVLVGKLAMSLIV